MFTFAQRLRSSKCDKCYAKVTCKILTFIFTSETFYFNTLQKYDICFVKLEKLSDLNDLDKELYPQQVC